MQHRTMLPAVLFATLLAAGCGGGSDAGADQSMAQEDAAATPGAAQPAQAMEASADEPAWTATYEGFTEGEASGVTAMGMALGSVYKLTLSGAEPTTQLQMTFDGYESGQTGTFTPQSAMLLLPTNQTCTFEDNESFANDGAAFSVTFEEGGQGTVDATMLCGGTERVPLNVDATFAQ